ncbi:MAG: tRNA (guanosine(46)-N7)-methyltransferase TrmB [Heliobacteriaceae bacterium]|nr:tRNA (guanosine(46)-N7)-methyltransferase TrmB [Heliobacteriaceae bacterium]
MRLRRLPGVRQALLQHSRWLIAEPEKLKNGWRRYAGPGKEIHLELGVGRGSFINTLAQNCPGIFWVGAELREEVLLAALKKAASWEAPNLVFLWLNIEQIPAVFGEGEVDRIYLNFSDPWPKNRQTKRRLTHPRFLAGYRQVLRPAGEIHLKTDNREFFTFSLAQFGSQGFTLQEVTADLHRDPAKATWGLSAQVMTEYEKRYTARAQPIYRCVAIPGDF